MLKLCLVYLLFYWDLLHGLLVGAYLLLEAVVGVELLRKPVLHRPQTLILRLRLLRRHQPLVRSILTTTLFPLPFDFLIQFLPFVKNFHEF